MWNRLFERQRLVKNGSRISGIARSNDGPISGLTVSEVDHIDFHIVRQTTTDSEGKYSFVVRNNHNLLRIERKGQQPFHSVFYSSVIECGITYTFRKARPMPTKTPSPGNSST